MTATDNSDPSPTVVSTPGSGSFFAAGTNTVNCYAYDSSHNTNSSSFLVAVDRAPFGLAPLSTNGLKDQVVTLSLATLKAGMSDLDGDVLSITAAGPASTNGGVVSLTGASVTYQPALNYVGADAFRYTVGDGRGGFGTKTVLVTVTTGASVGAANLVFGPAVINGVFTVRYLGTPGTTYTIESAAAVGTGWSKKTNLLAPAASQGFGIGVFQFTEAVTTTNRFYRTVYPAY